MPATIKRYWGVLPMSASQEEAEAFQAFDAKLTPSDIREMQIIDADCNDCAHFKRGEMVKTPGLTMFKGHCLKHDRSTIAYPTQFSGHECFEHRRKEPIY